MAKMIELKTELPNDANVRWMSNGYCSWLVDDDGNEYTPPKWVYRLVGEAKIEGRNQVRHDITQALKQEK